MGERGLTYSMLEESNFPFSEDFSKRSEKKIKKEEAFMGKKIVRIEIILEENDVRECFCLFGEKAYQAVVALKNAYSHASIGDMLKGWEMVVVNSNNAGAKNFWDH